MLYHRSIIQLNAVGGSLDLSEALFTHWHDTNQMAAQQYMVVCGRCDYVWRWIIVCGWITGQSRLWGKLLAGTPAFILQFSSLGVQTWIYEQTFSIQHSSHCKVKHCHNRQGRIENGSSSLFSALPLISLREALLFILVRHHHRLLQRISANAYAAQIYYSFSQLLRHISWNLAPLS